MDDAEHWRPVPLGLTLPENVVHVWRAELTPTSPELLSVDERDKAARFRFDKDRDCYTAARSILRMLIGKYERVKPEDIQFVYNNYGKPSVEGSSLRFNASHSAHLALFAFARNRNVGVDLEQVRSPFEALDIASRFFSEEEIAAITALPTEAHASAFFTCWTRKEAFIKAHGSGLSLPLRKFAVSVQGAARLLRTEFDADALGRWTLHDLMPGTNFVGALAVEGQPQRLDLWRWG